MLVRCSSCFEQYERVYEVCPHCGYVRGTPAAEPFYINPGNTLQGRYSLGKVLGYGGFGIIYKAWDKKLQTAVAIKEYFPSGIVSRRPGSKNVSVYAKKREAEFNHGLMRFIDEARNMAKFDLHNNIVYVYGYFEENQTAYIVMEFLNGVTLSEFLKTGSLDIESSLFVINSVCQALKTVHAAGIIHRDVSPDNIFICADNRIKLIDFGTARFSPDEEKLMTVILKPGYAPPEQYEKINVQGPWTDIYSLGATLYFILTGNKPDESTGRKTNDTLLPPSAINPEIPQNISNTVMKAMAPDRHLRFRTIDEFEKGLNQERKVVSLKKEISRRKRRRTITALLSAIAVIAALTAFIYFFYRQRVDETLNDARIQVWYELTGNDFRDKAKYEAYAAIASEFRGNYSNIEIVLEAYESDEYYSRIQSAIEAGTAPTLFESTSLDSAMLSNAIDLIDVVGRIEENRCYFLEDYDIYFPARNRLPLGFAAPVVYVNTMYRSDGAAGSGSAAQGEFDSHVRASDDTLPPEISGNSISADYIHFGGSREQFIIGEAQMLYSDTMDFFSVQAALPTRYKVLRIDGDRIACSFVDMFSISECGDDERKAAERLLLYMMSDSAQDYLYVRNSTGRLPLSIKALDVFVSVYADFDGFFDNIDSYRFSAIAP